MCPNGNGRDMPPQCVWTANGLLLWVRLCEFTRRADCMKKAPSNRTEPTFECNYSTVLHHFYLFIFTPHFSPTSAKQMRRRKKKRTFVIYLSFCCLFACLAVKSAYGILNCSHILWHGVQKRARQAAGRKTYTEWRLYSSITSAQRLRMFERTWRGR